MDTTPPTDQSHSNRSGSYAIANFICTTNRHSITPICKYYGQNHALGALPSNINSASEHD